MAATNQLTLAKAWDQIAQREVLSRYNSLGKVKAAAATSNSLFEAAEKARMDPKTYSRVCTWFGIVDPQDGGRPIQFPPEDRAERIEMLRNGEFPEGARAVKQWGGPDE